jgi:ammonia channel protein AmtB
LVTIAYAALETFLIGKVVGLLTGGPRASAEDKDNGLDVTEHDEVGDAGENAEGPVFAGMD